MEYMDILLISLFFALNIVIFFLSHRIHYTMDNYTYYGVRGPIGVAGVYLCDPSQKLRTQAYDVKEFAAYSDAYAYAYDKTPEVNTYFGVRGTPDIRGVYSNLSISDVKDTSMIKEFDTYNSAYAYAYPPADQDIPYDDDVDEHRLYASSPNPSIITNASNIDDFKYKKECDDLGDEDVAEFLRLQEDIRKIRMHQTAPIGPIQRRDRYFHFNNGCKHDSLSPEEGLQFLDTINPVGRHSNTVDEFRAKFLKQKQLHDRHKSVDFQQRSKTKREILEEILDVLKDLRNEFKN